MGRKKGKQSGEFQSKSQSAQHRRTLYVDHASEADRYRNPTPSGDIGRGHGYRCSGSSSHGSEGRGGCRRRGDGYGDGGGDKWSSIFSSSSRSGGGPRTTSSVDDDPDRRAAAAAAALSRLRRLLEERRSEDRLRDRRLRLRLQQSRMPEVARGDDGPSSSNDDDDTRWSCDLSIPGHRGGGGGGDRMRHESGWLLSHDDDAPRYSEATTVGDGTEDDDDVVPSLQMMAARALGPSLPAYCAACGCDFVGESLKSLSSVVLSEVAISLASSSATSSSADDIRFPASSDDEGERPRDGDGTIFWTTDGAVRALVRSGAATGLVLRGAPLRAFDDDDDAMNVEDGGDVDARWLSDDGLISLCPRISSADDLADSSLLDCDAPREESVGDCSVPSVERDSSSCDCDWEAIDFDMGLNSRMSGCFHLKRLELIDIPLRRPASSSHSGGISIRALKTVLRSCSNLTHLSLGGCFFNWEDIEDSYPLSSSAVAEELDDISILLCGNRSFASLTRSIVMLSKLHGNDGEEFVHLNPQLMLHDVFYDNFDEKCDVSGFDELLPELKVLDVSHCSWVTPRMIIHYLLNVWRRCFVSTGETSDIRVNWGDEAEDLGGHTDLSTSDGGGVNSINISSNGKLAKIAPLLRHLNVRGCNGLLQDSPTLPSWIEGWRLIGLFDGIDLSIDRHTRR